MYTRGDLAEAENLYRKSLAINQQLNRMEGVATAYGTNNNSF